MAVYETMSSETVSYTAINSGVSAAELFRERRSVSRAKLLDRNSKTGVMVVGWLTAYGLTFAFVEPFQVLVLAGAPCLVDEEARGGRCCRRRLMSIRGVGR